MVAWNAGCACAAADHVIGKGEDRTLHEILLGLVVLDQILDVVDLVDVGEPVTGCR